MQLCHYAFQYVAGSLSRHTVRLCYTVIILSLLLIYSMCEFPFTFNAKYCETDYVEYCVFKGSTLKQ